VAALGALEQQVVTVEVGPGSSSGLGSVWAFSVLQRGRKGVPVGAGPKGALLWLAQ
jgi:hypothetical protein